MAFFIELEQNIFFICMETQGPQIAKTILRKKNRAAGIELPDFSLYRKLQSSKRYGTGTQADTKINGTGQKA